MQELLQQLAARKTIEANVALVAAHPDDETIGAGAMLALFPRLLLIHVTDGAPRNREDAGLAGFVTDAAYAAARRCELHAALAVAGAAPLLAELGVADQAASHEMPGIAARLAALFARHRIAAVITHPYEGGHPDHDATAWAVHAAIGLGPAHPDVFEMTSYHAGPGGAFETGCFLPGPPPIVLDLTPEEREHKRAMLDQFTTQRHVLAAFETEREAFRPAPRYDFAQAPHAGPLYYDGFGWGITGADWRELAEHADRDLKAARCGA